MLFKSLFATQASGSVGGVTASRNRGGNYLRARAIPVDPATALQVAIRNAIAQVSTAWVETLTQTQRDNWAVYAENVQLINPLGDPINVTGQNMYVRSNVPRVQAGLPRVDDAPTIFDLGTFTDPNLTAEVLTPSIDVEFTNTDLWANEDDSAMLVYVSQPQNPTINFHKGPYRFLGRIDGDSTTPPTSPASFTPPLALTLGQRLFARIAVSRADGRLSNKFRDDTLVASGT